MKDGDFLRLEYDAFVKETGQIVDTTHEDIAKEHDIYNERVKYGPIAVIVGSGQVVKGLDQDLLNAEVGNEREIDVPSADAFGERDPKLVEVMPMNKILALPEFRKGDRYPTEGMDIRINNRIGIINRIFAGRVRVDFNNRWAGKTINYKYMVSEIIKKKEEKLLAVIESDFGSSEEFVVDFVKKDEVNITLPDMVKLDSSWPMAKFKLVSDLRNHFDVKVVRFIEEYIKKEEPAAEEKTAEVEEKPAEVEEKAPEETEEKSDGAEEDSSE
ncbi:MAG: FKBP-type peptidyl-prolyl cis-trans isomerase [Thermoplasmatota archaeon]